MLRILDSVLVLGSAMLLWLPMQGQDASQSASGKISLKPISITQGAANQAPPGKISASAGARVAEAAPQGTVRHVSVRGSEANLEIEIDTAGSPASPDTQAIADPDRIVIDFPGALPAAELRALEVNRGALKRIRTGLFFSNPPITRVVLDLTGPRNYRVMSTVNAVIVKLESASGASDAAVTPRTQERESGHSSGATPASSAALKNAAVAANPYALPLVSSVAMQSAPAAASQLDGMPSLLPQNQMQQNQARVAALAGVPLRVSYADGLLTIHAAKATLAEVLFEVQRQTKAEIAIPAGAEQEGVVADIGPAAARDVLATLLNGSHYNFIFVGDEDRLEKVILTQRQFTN
jgi:hypothetical protein